MPATRDHRPSRRTPPRATDGDWFNPSIAHQALCRSEVVLQPEFPRRELLVNWSTRAGLSGQIAVSTCAVVAGLTLVWLGQVGEGPRDHNNKHGTLAEDTGRNWWVIHDPAIETLETPTKRPGLGLGLGKEGPPAPGFRAR